MVNLNVKKQESFVRLLIGAKADGNLGDIEVNSISIKNNGYGGFIQIYNASGEQTAYLGTNVSKDGMLQLFDKDNNLLAFLGLGGDNEGGLVQTYYDGSNWAMIGSSDQSGYFSLRSGEEDVIPYS